MQITTPITYLKYIKNRKEENEIRIKEITWVYAVRSKIIITAAKIV